MRETSKEIGRQRGRSASNANTTKPRQRGGTTSVSKIDTCKPGQNQLGENFGQLERTKRPRRARALKRVFFSNCFAHLWHLFSKGIAVYSPVYTDPCFIGIVVPFPQLERHSPRRPARARPRRKVSTSTSPLPRWSWSLCSVAASAAWFVVPTTARAQSRNRTLRRRRRRRLRLRRPPARRRRPTCRARSRATPRRWSSCCS